jgi:lantibiotic modifying enzyme
MNQVIGNSDREIINNLITDIEVDIDANFELIGRQTSNKISLYSGFTGVALFYGYLAKHTNDDSYYEKCQKTIDYCIENLNSTIQPSLYGGFTGLAWTLRHLINMDVFDSDSLSSLGLIDPIIDKSTELFIKEKHYSLMYGLIGIGIYYLEQIESKANTQNAPFLHLQKIVISLNEMAIENGDSIFWIDYASTISKKSTTPIYNLGIPHGITGIMCFLSKVFEIGIEKEKIIHLLKGCVKWLLKQKNNFYNISYYPPLVGVSYSPHLTRLAWSYGDLCSALALLKVAKVLEDEILEEEALSTALITTQRNLRTSNIYTKVEKDFNYLDIGLCKGTSGGIILYSNLNEHFKNDELRKVQNFWIDLSIKSKNKIGGLGGYKAYVSVDGEAGEWRNDLSFLDGVSGFGLTLISLINPELRKWQNLLLV